MMVGYYDRWQECPGVGNNADKQGIRKTKGSQMPQGKVQGMQNKRFTFLFIF